MSQVLTNVKKGVFTVLNADGTLTGLVTGIYGEQIPSGVTYPYLQVFISFGWPQDNFANWRDDVTVEAYCCAKNTATATAQETAGAIAAEVTRILDDNNSLAIPGGYTTSRCIREDSEEEYDRITDIFFDIIRYSLIVSKSKR